MCRTQSHSVEMVFKTRILNKLNETQSENFHEKIVIIDDFWS